MSQSDILESVELLDTFEANTKKLEESYKYLHKLDDIKKITNDKTSLKIFLFLNKLSKSEKYNSCLVNYNLIKRYKIYKLLKHILSTCFLESREFMRNTEYLDDNSYDSTVKDLKIKFYFIYYSIDVISYLIQFSEIFYSKFHKVGGTEQILTILKDDEFVRRCLNLKSDSKIRSNIGIDVVQQFTLCFRNLTKLADENKSEWTEMKASSHLINFLVIVQDHKSILILAYLAIANVITENEIEVFSGINALIKQITSLILNFTIELANKTEVRNFIDSKSGAKIEICYTVYDKIVINLIELLEALNHIAVNDKMKYKIYQEANFSSCLKKVIVHGNDFEKQHATRLLWQLSFDQNVCKKIYEDDELVKYLDELNQTTNQNKFLKQNIFGIFWLSKIFSANSSILKSKFQTDFLNSKIKNEFSKKPAVTLRSKSQVEIKRDHIMISYNRESRDICLKIKDELEKDGHNVWIDVQDISGSSLESMALAIENSKCVLICMTEKYKLSPNCRAEAEYSFNLRKPIIPLIMQPNYTPDGWLGIILGTKIFINFSKYEFEECIIKLKNEVKNMKNLNSDSSSNYVQIDKNTSSTSSNVDKKKLKEWTNQDVNIWLKEKQIHPAIMSILSMFNGELLIQLSRIFKNSPEYYYSSLSNHGKIDLHSIVFFTYEFEKLFCLI